MLTPNGRFKPNTKLCLSMSDFHPETWVPAWSVASILNGVLSFMLESTPTVGSVETSVAERRRLALASHAFNRKTPLFCELFPEMVVAADPDAPGADGAEGEGDSAQQQQLAERPTFPVYVAIIGVVAIAVGVGYIVREL